MQLEALHHVSMITADVRANVAFYVGLLGLRLVKKTVNFDAPRTYHLYYGDERGSPGSILTWFEFPHARKGRPGVGMVYRLELAVAGEAALAFWSDRLGRAGHPVQEMDGRLRFRDYDGLELELVIAPRSNPPLRAEHPEVPAERALLGVEGARAYAVDVSAEHPFLTEVLGFRALGEGEFRLDGSERNVHWGYDPGPSEPGRGGAGTVHHIAWGARDDELESWRDCALAAGCEVIGPLDRDYFRAIYVREPRGVLFEIATLSPGFAVDEEPAHLGESLRLPAQHEHLRERLEAKLTPLTNPRTAWRRGAR